MAISRNTRKSFVSLAAVALVLLLASAGCVRSTGVLSNLTFRKSKTHYNIGPVPGDWRRVSLRAADIAYIHDKDGSTLLINSKCENAEDAPLLALTYHLLIGMTDQKILEQKTLPSSDREALVTVVEVKLDGVPRKLKTFVLKKDLCIYDIVLATAPAHFEERLPAFESVLSGFNVPGLKP